MNGQAFTALQSATSALKNVHKELDVDKVQDVMDDLAEQHELSNEIANAISNPVGRFILSSFTRFDSIGPSLV